MGIEQIRRRILNINDEFKERSTFETRPSIDDVLKPWVDEEMVLYCFVSVDCPNHLREEMMNILGLIVGLVGLNAGCASWSPKNISKIFSKMNVVLRDYAYEELSKKKVV